MALLKSIEISELLCYASHNLGRLDTHRLKSMLSNFYSVEVAYNAKELLVKLVGIIRPEKWARPNMRRGKASVNMATDDKTKKEIDDIIGVLTFVDENHLREKLPRFAAENPDFLPSSNWVAGIMNKFNISIIFVHGKMFYQHSLDEICILFLNSQKIVSAHLV